MDKYLDMGWIISILLQNKEGTRKIYKEGTRKIYKEGKKKQKVGIPYKAKRFKKAMGQLITLKHISGKSKLSYLHIWGCHDHLPPSS